MDFFTSRRVFVRTKFFDVFICLVPLCFAIAGLSFAQNGLVRGDPNRMVTNCAVVAAISTCEIIAALLVAFYLPYVDEKNAKNNRSILTVTVLSVIPSAIGSLVGFMWTISTVTLAHQVPYLAKFGCGSGGYGCANVMALLLLFYYSARIVVATGICCYYWMTNGEDIQD